MTSSLSISWDCSYKTSWIRWRKISKSKRLIWRPRTSCITDEMKKEFSKGVISHQLKSYNSQYKTEYKHVYVSHSIREYYLTYLPNLPVFMHAVAIHNSPEVFVSVTESHSMEQHNHSNLWSATFTAIQHLPKSTIQYDFVMSTLQITKIILSPQK